MRILGIKISAECVDNESSMWEGYWSYRTKEEIILTYTGIIRISQYDAEQDAIRSSKIYSENHEVIFISEGYQI